MHRTAKNKVAPIVGGVVGGIGGIALIVLIAILIMRRRRTRVTLSGATEPGSGIVQPFVAAPEVGQSGSKTMDMSFMNPSGNAPSVSIGNTDVRSEGGHTESLPPPYR
ncbi:hypothetical protein R3P38DRAFT_2756341 [Favolaschia claudopus]|uniref:Uncharacterized protein n=1 Tax=Favolaschia claudopus TaxID=2862362 RepID=A0AAW0EFB4_9AGAR